MEIDETGASDFYSRENKLLWEAPREVVTPTILAELKDHKNSLLEFLNLVLRRGPGRCDHLMRRRGCGFARRSE